MLAWRLRVQEMSGGLSTFMESYYLLELAMVARRLCIQEISVGLAAGDIDFTQIPVTVYRVLNKLSQLAFLAYALLASALAPLWRYIQPWWPTWSANFHCAFSHELCPQRRVASGPLHAC